MSAEQVLVRLRAWGEALTERDPAWTAHLRPGPSEAQVRRTCAP